MSAMDVLKALGGSPAAPPITLPASIPLELSGEAVRGRICIFNDADGREWALRPDLTLPVARDEIDSRRAGLAEPSSRYYHGPVFRLPNQLSDPVEFDQMGMERFGAPSTPETDLSVFSAICSACSAEGVSEGTARFGDLSVFPAFVDALGLSDEITAGLKRAFRQEGGVRAFLEAERGGAVSGLSKRMQGMAREDVAAFVDDIFAITGIRPVGERSGDDIIDRLHERAQAAAGAEVSDSERTLLNTVLDVDVPVFEAAESFARLASESKLDGLDPLLERLTVLTDGLRDAELSAFTGTGRFATRFGRRFTYYDGFVFEIAASEALAEEGQPFAAGGRYDRLLSDLSGGEVSASAIGGVIIPYRLQAALGGVS